MTSSAVMEAFSFLKEINTLPGIKAGWVERVPELTIKGDRNAAMNALRPTHEACVSSYADGSRWWRAEQVHGKKVAIVPGADEITAPDGLPVVPHVDGLITNTPGQLLSIYVADCGAIWLADKKTGAIGLLHSGKKGTELNILQQAVDLMAEHYGTNPTDLVCALSPCIRLPHYEIDFASDIEKQAQAIGIGSYIDCGLDTAADLDRFYSYRIEKGETGRMMALLLRE